MPLTREDLIEESVEEYVKNRLGSYDYDGSNVTVREAFPTPNERAAELTKTTLASMISFDDGGRPLEIGSTLTEYVHTVEFWVFAINPKMGRNLANTVKQIVRHDGVIPLLQVDQAGKPQIDALIVDRAATARQINSSPRPWDENVWTCTVRLIDEYMP